MNGVIVTGDKDTLALDATASAAVALRALVDQVRDAPPVWGFDALDEPLDPTEHLANALLIALELDRRVAATFAHEDGGDQSDQLARLDALASALTAFLDGWIP